MNTTLKENKKFVGMLSALGLVAMLGVIPLFNAFAALGANAALATSVYYALNVIGWGVMAASIVSSFGLASIGGYAVWAAVKKMALKQFVKW